MFITVSDRAGISDDRRVGFRAERKSPQRASLTRGDLIYREGAKGSSFELSLSSYDG